MLIETIEELLILAKKYKYSNENIELIKSAYVIAAEYSKNKFRYRKKNRPFINHLVSTCSILIYSNVNIEFFNFSLTPLIGKLRIKCGFKLLESDRFADKYQSCQP